MNKVAKGTIAKVDEDKRLVFGWANIIKDEQGQLLLDRQDDFIDSEDELEKAAYKYVLNSRDGGEMHVRKGVSTMVESVVLTKEKQAALGIPEGTVPTGWWIGFKVTDDRVWDQVKKGDYVGFSVHGTGQRQKKQLRAGEYTEIGKSDSGQAVRVTPSLLEFLSKSVASQADQVIARAEEVRKGGPGSGENPGHAFRGNQHTGGIKGRGSSSGGGSRGAATKPKPESKPKAKPKAKAPSKPDKSEKARSALNRLKSGKKVTVSEENLEGFLARLQAAIKESEKTSGSTPNVNLCQITVPGTNLFCGENKGVPRNQMPQLGGKPRKGSEAAKLPKITWPDGTGSGEVDGTQQFISHLKDSGIKVSSDAVLASSLKASQNELVGAKVVGIKNNPDFDPGAGEIFVSRDGYVIDGHHRWAAQVARDYKDGDGDDLNMNVKVVDMDIMDVLKEANSWADEFGILPKEAKAGS